MFKPYRSFAYKYCLWQYVAMYTDWFTIEKIDDTTYAISEYGHDEHMHSYLLIGTEHALLIDTGLGISNIKEVVDTLTDHPITVVTTHAHWDHIGSHHAFDVIAIHRDDAKWLKHGLPIPVQAVRSQLSKEHFHNTPPKDFDVEQYEVPTVMPTRILTDGDTFDLGGRLIEVIHTPGHSPGHICLYERERGYIFTGDLIYLGTLFAFYPSTEPVSFRQSIHRIASLPNINRILPSHHGLDIPLDIVHRIKDAFDKLNEKGSLHHGSGIYDYGDFKIHI